jgi:flavin reductase (DIM6/NTAB) family NADH-FMN oxidoreductase RutF
MMADFSAAFADLSASQRYKLLTASVIPRPIAFVTTLGPGGIVNAAPYSFFNVFSQDPALVILGIEGRAGGGQKDTARNIRAHESFVVHLVDEDLAAAMNLTAVNFPPDVSEAAIAGLATTPGTAVPVPRLTAAPFALECRHTVTLGFSTAREIVIGEVVHFHARAGIVDPETLRVDLDHYRPVGRLFANLYSRQHDRFELVRETLAEYQARVGTDESRSLSGGLT